MGPSNSSLKRILIVDDDELFLLSVCAIIEKEGHDVQVASTGTEALELISQSPPSLILLDIGLPGMSGELVCREIRKRFPGVFLPIILISGKGTANQLVQSLAAGANDFVAKPFRNDQLLAKIRSFLGVKNLYETARGHAGQLRQFVSPQVADLVTSSNEIAPHKSRRKEVSVVFVDLRGFTAFVEKTEAEEVSQVLSDYYREVGTEVLEHGGTIGCLAGDGVMAFFNDPNPIENHAERALQFSLKVKERLSVTAQAWKKKGHSLNFGVGIATGVSTIGMIGFDGYWGYSVIGFVPNLAARLCSQAYEGQVLISKKNLGPLFDEIDSQEIGSMPLKGVQEPVQIFNVIAMKSVMPKKVG